MDVKTYFNLKREITNYCNKINCFDRGGFDCPLSIMNNNMHVNCTTLEQDYPEVAEKILREYVNEN